MMKELMNNDYTGVLNRGWAEWAIAHPVFGKMVNAVTEQRRTALLCSGKKIGA